MDVGNVVNNVLNKLRTVILNNKLNVFLSIVSLYLLTNFNMLGPIPAIPPLLIVLCSSRFHGISSKAYKLAFIGAIAVVVLLTNTNNQIAYPIINDIVKVDLSRIRTLEPSFGDPFVLLTKARDYLLKDRVIDGKIPHQWAEFKVTNVNIGHPDLGTSVYIRLVSLDPSVKNDIEYDMFTGAFDELRESGILITDKSKFTAWWILTV